MAQSLLAYLMENFPEVCDIISADHLYTIPGLTDADHKAVAGVPIYTDGIKCLIENCNTLMVTSKVVRNHMAEHLKGPNKTFRLTPEQLNEAIEANTETGVLYQRPFSKMSKKGFHNKVYEVDTEMHGQEVSLPSSSYNYFSFDKYNISSKKARWGRP